MEPPAHGSKIDAPSRGSLYKDRRFRDHPEANSHDPLDESLCSPQLGRKPGSRHLAKGPTAAAPPDLILPVSPLVDGSGFDVSLGHP